jgi:hypothetical protein
MKLTYPITANYVHNWTPKRALCELVSNMLDGGGQHTCRYDRRTRKLTLTNKDTVLSRDALLLGESDKRNSEGSIGQFGEGLKLACLVLRRARFPVLIKNGRAETWRPEIENVDTFGKPVLVMNIIKATRQHEDFVVEVEEVEASVWEEVEACFLALKRVDKVSTTYGDLLRDPTEVGNLYVRGVLICHVEDYRYGYNFKNVRVGRDREMPDTYDSKIAIRQIWDAVMSQSESEVNMPGRVAAFYDMVNCAHPEADALQYMNSDVLSDALFAEFKRRHGEDAMPVESTSDAEEASHYGARPVIVSGALFYVLASRNDVAALHTLRKKLAKTPTKLYTLDEIADAERRNFQRAFEVLRRARNGLDDFKISVADFHDEKLRGLYLGEEKKVLVARRVLGNFGKTLGVLVHEVAHEAGGDGSKAHVDAIDRLTTAIFELMAGEN